MTTRASATLRIRGHSLAIAAVLGALANGSAAAQDTHYWTNQYGDRANLLGGAVVGSAVDLSAVYYNPGALSLLESPDLILATKVFEWTQITAEGGSELDVAIGDDRLGLAPGFFAGLLPFRFLESDVLSYSAFTRQSFDARMRAVGTGEDDLFPPEGPEESYRSLGFEGKLTETWVGLTWSRAVGNIGFGVSTFVAARSQRGGRSALAQGYAPAELEATAIDLTGYSYSSYRLLWKTGLAGEWLGWSVGLTLTTPSVGLFGSGDIEINQTLFGVDLDGDGVTDPVFVADYQEGLSARYRSPFSAAVGASRRFGATTVHASAEWFAKVGESVVLDPEPFVGQSTGDTLNPTLTQSLDDVFNVSVGVQHRFSTTTAIFGSFRTDHSGWNAPTGFDVAVTTWDIYFLTAGARFQVAGADFTLGLGFGFGSEPVPASPPDNGVPGVLPDDLGVRYRNYRLIFAFAF
jgi:hypothetical protein